MNDSGAEKLYTTGKRNYQKMLLIATVLWLLVGVCVFWYRADVARIQREKADLNTVLTTDWGKFGSACDRLAWVDIIAPPVPFWEEEDGASVYSFVTDGSRLYVAELDRTDAAALAQVDYDRPRRLEGITGTVEQEVQEAALAMLASAKGDGTALTLSDYSDILGDACLRVNQNADAGAGIPKALGVLLGILGIAALADAWVQARGLKRYDPHIAEGISSNIEREMNSPTAQYFPQAGLYLTDHYLVNGKDVFCTLTYDEITGIEPQELRTYGVLVSRYLLVFTQDGRTCRVGVLDGWGKKKKQELTEMQTAILEKCPQLQEMQTRES